MWMSALRVVKPKPSWLIWKTNCRRARGSSASRRHLKFIGTGVVIPCGQAAAQTRRICPRLFSPCGGLGQGSDFHVGQGWSVEPLPFRGMDDQAYDHLTRPVTINDAWIGKYNTR